jgi:hypothetical protein
MFVVSVVFFWHVKFISSSINNKNKLLKINKKKYNKIIFQLLHSIDIVKIPNLYEIV